MTSLELQVGFYTGPVQPRKFSVRALFYLLALEGDYPIAIPLYIYTHTSSPLVSLGEVSRIQIVVLEYFGVYISGPLILEAQHSGV